jgi:peptide deformylase
MTSQNIITTSNPKIREKSKRVTFIDDSIKRLAADMIEATIDWERKRKHEFGAALAAIQLGKPYRVVVIRNDFEDKDNKGFTVFINPEIVKLEGRPSEDMEGCLSVRDIYGSVARYPKVKVKALNLEGKEVRLAAEGFLARVFQHEIDHTKGIIFTDHISDPAKLFQLDPDGKLIHIKE